MCRWLHWICLCDDDVDGGGRNEIGSAIMLYSAVLLSIFGKYWESLAVYSFYYIYIYSHSLLFDKEREIERVSLVCYTAGMQIKLNCLTVFTFNNRRISRKFVFAPLYTLYFASTMISREESVRDLSSGSALCKQKWTSIPTHTGCMRTFNNCTPFTFSEFQRGKKPTLIRIDFAAKFLVYTVHSVFVM